MERDKENFDGWMIDYMAGRLSEEDLQQFHALLNSDVFYKKRFKELSKEYAKYLIPHFAEEEANNYEKLLHRLDFIPIFFLEKYAPYSCNCCFVDYIFHCMLLCME